MTDIIKEETPEGGTTDQPSQQVPPQALNLSADDVQKLVEALKPHISEEVSKSTQSFKDKRFAKLDDKIGGFESQLARFQELTGKGIAQDDALWRMKVEDQLGITAGGKEGESSEVQKAGSPQPTTSGTANLDPGIFGLNPNDVEVVNMMRSGKTSAQDFYTLAEQKKAKEKLPAPGSVMPSGTGGSVPVDGDIADLSAKLGEYNKNPTKYRKEIKETSEKLAKSLAR